MPEASVSSCLRKVYGCVATLPLRYPPPATNSIACDYDIAEGVAALQKLPDLQLNQPTNLPLNHIKHCDNHGLPLLHPHLLLPRLRNR